MRAPTVSPLMKWVFIGLTVYPATSGAEIFSFIEPGPMSELWLNPGFYSYHFQREKKLNNNNFGLGGEYRFSTVSAFLFGEIDNSDRKTSHYVGWYWRPVGVGPVRLGAIAGAMDGYPKMVNGGWFFAVIPTAGIEYKNVGANLMYVPSYRDRLYGTISFQVKFKVY
jgi:hypothetical protein